MKKLHIHPIFLLWGLHLLLTGRGSLFCHILLLWSVAEGAKLLYGSMHGVVWKKLLLTPLGIRGVAAGVYGLNKRERFFFYLSGSLGGLLCSVCLFALEYKSLAGLSLLLAGLRLVPLLPLDGGRLLFGWIEKSWGTLQAAGWITKIGVGAGCGCVLWGMIVAVLFPYDLSLLFMGLYLIYANKREFLQIAKEFYFSMIEAETKPFREIRVTGEESPLEMAIRLNRENTAIFLRKDQQGVSQERVLRALFLGRGNDWLWQAAEKGKKDFRAKAPDFGYDEKEVRN